MKLDNSINSFLHNSEILNTLESKTNINRKSLTIFGGLSICFIIYYIMGMGLVANLIGFLYPSYKSFKSLQSKKPDDDEQWLMYFHNLFGNMFVKCSMFSQFFQSFRMCLDLFGPFSDGCGGYRHVEDLYQHILKPV